MRCPDRERDRERESDRERLTDRERDRERLTRREPLVGFFDFFEAFEPLADFLEPLAAFETNIFLMAFEAVLAFLETLTSLPEAFASTALPRLVRALHAALADVLREREAERERERDLEAVRLADLERERERDLEAERLTERERERERERDLDLTAVDAALEIVSASVDDISFLYIEKIFFIYKELLLIWMVCDLVGV